jgi:hypothetical protein
MAEGIIIGVVAGLIVAAIIGLVGWLRKEENRERLRQAVCQHDWYSPMDENRPGDPVIVLTPFSEECRKCGKTR